MWRGKKSEKSINNIFEKWAKVIKTIQRKIQWQKSKIILCNQEKKKRERNQVHKILGHIHATFKTHAFGA